MKNVYTILIVFLWMNASALENEPVNSELVSEVVQQNCPTAKMNIPKRTLCPGDSIKMCLNNVAGNSVSWNFGDGTTANQVCIAKPYVTPGNYTITVQVSNSSCTQTLIDSITVLGRLDKKHLFTLSPSHAVSMDSIHFDALGNFKNVEWNISRMYLIVNPDSTPLTLEDLFKSVVVEENKWVYTWRQHFSERFYSCGIYTVTFNHNTCGISESETKILDIDKATPSEVKLETTFETYEVGDTVEFHADGGEFYFWSFGDGKMAMTADGESDITHVYKYPGTKIITLTGVDNCINASTKKLKIHISPKPHCKGEIEIYPNPVKHDALLKIPSCMGKCIVVSIYNRFGMPVFIKNYKNYDADGINLHLHKLYPGYYYVKIEDGNSRVSGSFIKK